MKKYVYDVAKLLDDKKAEDIVILDFEGEYDVTDYAIICNVDTQTQIKALSDYVERYMADNQIKAMNRNTVTANNPWVLLDFVFMIVHIFKTETREFYNIEKLWSTTAKRIEYNELKIKN